MCKYISVLLFVFAISYDFQATSISVAADPDLQPPAHKKLVKSNPDIELLLEPIRQKYQVPGIVAGIVENDHLAVAGAVGLRKHGSPVAITVNDDLHLGSNTKAMTATLLACWSRYRNKPVFMCFQQFQNDLWIPICQIHSLRLVFRKIDKKHLTKNGRSRWVSMNCDASSTMRSGK